MINPVPEKELLKRNNPRDEDVRGPYFRDQTAIIHSMAFRRLKHKTQVFFSPDNDHICTRIEHVLHVATIAATICKGLNKKDWTLDGELAYAIGLGHDLGHAPFGHAGEEALSKCLDKKFMHEINSFRVVNTLANNGNGLNLTYAVKDGIICHNGEIVEKTIQPEKRIKNLEAITDRTSYPNTYEGCIVRMSDKIAYLGRDIEDAIISKIIKTDDIPSTIVSELGNKNGEIINSFVIDIIEESTKTNKIGFSESKLNLIRELMKFNYDKIYRHEKLADYSIFVNKIISSLYDYLGSLFMKYGFNFAGYESEKLDISKCFGKYLDKMQAIYRDDSNIPNQILSDYISGMTDSFAINAMQKISLPKPLKF